MLPLFTWKSWCRKVTRGRSVRTKETLALGSGLKKGEASQSDVSWHLSFSSRRAARLKHANKTKGTGNSQLFSFLAWFICSRFLHARYSVSLKGHAVQKSVVYECNLSALEGNNLVRLATRWYERLCLMKNNNQCLYDCYEWKRISFWVSRPTSCPVPYNSNKSRIRIRRTHPLTIYVVL